MTLPGTLHRLIAPALFSLPLVLAGCAGDETVAAYGGADRSWQLRELDGAPFGARATLAFQNPGHIVGQGPCNSYSSPMTAPYPWFEARNLTLTRLASPDLADETAFLTALMAMEFAEVSGDVLILSNTDGREMVFSSDG